MAKRMLSRDDVQQIAKLMRAETEPIRRQLDQQGKDLQGLKQDVQGLKDSQKRIEAKLDREIESITAFHRKVDEVIEDHRVRLEALEEERSFPH